METWDAIRARRNVRSFTDEPVPDAVLDQILEAARRTPSSSNQQRWDFVVVTDRDLLVQLAEVWRGAGFIAHAAAAIALVAPAQEDPRMTASVHYDFGQVTMSIMIAAADQGVGSCHTVVMDQELGRRLLGYPDDHTCTWLLGLGYPADRPLTPIRTPNRRPFDEVVHRGGW